MIPSSRTLFAIINFLEGQLDFWNGCYALVSMLLGAVIFAPIFLPIIVLHWLCCRLLVEVERRCCD